FPIGKADNLSGVIDLLEGEAYTADSQTAQPVPDTERGSFDQLREMLVESACELDDDLINKYLEGEEITTEELTSAVRIGVREKKLFPVLATSGNRSIGMDALLNAIVHLLPSPEDIELKLSDGSTVSASELGKPAALVFKTVSDANIGRLSY